MFRRALASLALAILFAACGGDKLTHVAGPGGHTEVFSQNAASKIDLLWVVDDSGSMADKQAKVAASFQRFMDEFSRGAIDYRVAVTTTDVFSDNAGAQGEFYGNPKVIASTDDDPLAEFQQNIKVGIGGSGDEAGLAAAKLALDKVNVANAPILAARQRCIQGCSVTNGGTTCVANCQTQNEPEFLRPDAYLYVVFVSDEDDHSGEEAIFYARSLELVKGVGNEAAVSASAIVGDPNGPACNARPGTKYAGAVSYTGGILGSICDASFDQNLSRLAEDAVGLKRHFLLGSNPQLNTLELQLLYRCDTPTTVLAQCASITSTCDGAAPDTLGFTCTPKQAEVVDVDADHPEGYTAGWSYQCADNSIAFHADASCDSVPGLRSQLQVSYTETKDVQCAP